MAAGQPVGAVASLVAAFVTNFALYFITGQRLDYWDPNVFLAALVAGVGALVVVSLLTAPEPAGKLGSFFQRLDTSSDHDNVAVSAASSGGRPRAADAHAPLLLVNLLRLRRGARGRGWRAYREDVGGLAFGWVVVVVLVAITAGLLAM